MLIAGLRGARLWYLVGATLIYDICLASRKTFGVVADYGFGVFRYGDWLRYRFGIQHPAVERQCLYCIGMVLTYISIREFRISYANVFQNVLYQDECATNTHMVQLNTLDGGMLNTKFLVLLSSCHPALLSFYQIHTASDHPHGSLIKKWENKKRSLAAPFSIFKITCLPLPQQQQQPRSYQPWGCYLRRSDPSFLREPERRRNLRTVRRSAYDPWCRSYRKRKDQRPCCRDAAYGLYHHRMQRRSSFYRFRCTTSCRYRQRDAGTGWGWWSYR